MSTMRQRLAVVAAVSILASVAPAQGRTEVRFAKSYDAAFTQAKAESKPILFCIMKDAEIGCSRMLEG
ncbi:MAG TPA: hypothetical protein VEI02_02365, partial [Planctomycetota bacterium]|nr:hypothetical protein [Planctomycetota bacterium]